MKTIKTILLVCFALFMGATTVNAKKHGIKVLVLCTGNTCRSQMAHGLLESYGKDLAVYSGGVKAEPRVNPRAVLVMREMGIDISDHKPCQVDEYMDEDWDYVITVCDNAHSILEFLIAALINAPHQWQGIIDEIINVSIFLNDLLGKALQHRLV